MRAFLGGFKLTGFRYRQMAIEQPEKIRYAFRELWTVLRHPNIPVVEWGFCLTIHNSRHLKLTGSLADVSSRR